MRHRDGSTMILQSTVSNLSESVGLWQTHICSQQDNFKLMADPTFASATEQILHIFNGFDVSTLCKDLS